MTTELLGLGSPWVRNQQSPVVSNKLLLEFHRGVCVDVFRVVSDNRLGNRLTDGIDLGGVSTTLYTNTDVHCSEGILTGNEDGLVDLETEDLRLEEVDG